MLAGRVNVCAPTRCALMTGQHTGHTAVRFNRGDLALRSDNVTIGGRGLRNWPDSASGVWAMIIWGTFPM